MRISKDILLSFWETLFYRKDLGCSLIYQESPQQVALHVWFGRFYNRCLSWCNPKRICFSPLMKPWIFCLLGRCLNYYTTGATGNSIIAWAKKGMLILIHLVVSHLKNFTDKTPENVPVIINWSSLFRKKTDMKCWSSAQHKFDTTVPDVKWY